MNTFKKFFSIKTVIFSIPIFLYFFAYFLIPHGYTKWEPFHPMAIAISVAILGLVGSTIFFNAQIKAQTKTKKIIFLLLLYVSFTVYFIGYGMVQFTIFSKKFGFIADITQENSSLTYKITDCLYTILAPSFVTVFVAVGVILFTVYLIQSARKNKQNKQQQATETTTV